MEIKQIRIKEMEGQNQGAETKEIHSTSSPIKVVVKNQNNNNVAHVKQRKNEYKETLLTKPKLAR